MADLELIAVGKTYPNGYQALKNINIRIEDGEFIVIVGPSGCGKSTLMRTVAGLEGVTCGQVKIGGKLVNDLEPAKRDISMVFQNYALYPHMTVFENMAYGLKIAKLPRTEIRQRVETVGQMLGLDKLLDRKPKQLSGGQRQRVAMGRAIVRNPKVFLFDEPLSNLDAKLRVQMRLEIKKLHQKFKVTSLYVTHDQVEAMTLADRIVVLNGGRVEQIGTPDEIFHEPASYFVADFMGSPPTNLLPVRINGSGEIDGPDYRVSLGSCVPLAARGKEVYLGIRPEHLILQRGGLPMELELVESLGTEKLLHLVFEQKRYVMIARTKESTSSLLEKKRLKVWVDHEENLRFFSKETGHRIY
ncbi:MAG: sn-glycerol-3-phosphate ABC transporter ATP-binding protein UgpC [Neisseriaceae bacterium]